MILLNKRLRAPFFHTILFSMEKLNALISYNPHKNKPLLKIDLNTNYNQSGIYVAMASR